LTALITVLREKGAVEKSAIQSFLTSDLGAPLPLHVSLSRPIGLATEQKDGFLTALERSVKSSGVRPFKFTFAGLDWVPNFETTRWFLVLRLQRPGGDELNKLLRVGNRVVRDFGQPPLYVPPASSTSDEAMLGSTVKAPRHGDRTGRARGAVPPVRASDAQDVSDAFHISVAWTLEPPSEELREATKTLVNDAQFDEIRGLGVKVEAIKAIKAKIGNVVTHIDLPVNVMEEKGLFGF